MEPPPYTNTNIDLEQGKSIESDIKLIKGLLVAQGSQLSRMVYVLTGLFICVLLAIAGYGWLILVLGRKD